MKTPTGARPAPDLLRQAAALVAQAITQLETDGRSCHCCGLMVYRNMNEVLAHRNLRNVPGKLRREAGYLDGTALREPPAHVHLDTES